MVAKAESLLKAKGLRKTSQRLQILEALLRSRRPLSAEDLHRGLSGRACDLATVYRNLQQLEEHALVNRTFLSDQIARYTTRSSEPHLHTHHIECRSCHRVTPVKSCLVDHQVEQLEMLGFREVTHRLEFQALCADCG